AFIACGVSRLPTPAYSQQQTNAYTEVPYPPPPARVELVPERPENEGAVWIDGEWTWEGKHWAWKRGRWVVPPPGATFSPWTTTRDATGVLYLAEGTWRDRDGGEIAAPPELAYAKPSGGGVVDPEGDIVPPSPIVIEQQRPPRSSDGGDMDVVVPPNDAMPL